MAHDLKNSPYGPVEGYACGDAHLANFGMFGAPDRSVVFDINDFDETYSPRPVEWDVKRLAVSIALAAKEQGTNDEKAATYARQCARAWREEIRRLSALPVLELWHLRSAEDQIVRWGRNQNKDRNSKELLAVHAGINAAKNRTGWSAVRKLTTIENGKRTFRNLPPLIAPMPKEGWQLAHNMYENYRESCREDTAELLRRYEIVDAAHKVVGVGSVGLLSLAVLLQGNGPDDLIVLQAKQAENSVLDDGTQRYSHQGQRVVTGQRRLQATGDPLLGWTTGAGGREYYVRQLRDMKWSPDLAKLEPRLVNAYGQACGGVLARAHSRGADPQLLATYLGEKETFDKAIEQYTRSYLAQVQRDYGTFLEAIKDGALDAGSGHDMDSWWQKTLRRGSGGANKGQKRSTRTQRRRTSSTSAAATAPEEPKTSRG